LYKTILWKKALVEDGVAPGVVWAYDI
jgi:hypothetical protein